MTASRVASRSASSMKCVVSRIVLPCDSSCRRPSQIRCRACGSRPVVGSSRIRSSGSLTSARASVSRRFMPPDSVRMCASRLLAEAREIEQLRECARRASRGRCRNSCRRRSRFSVTVKSGSRLSICGTTPTRILASRAALGTGWPTISIVPPSGSIRPRQQRSVVVLPAPLGPSRPKHSPRRISNDKPRTTSLSP